MGRPVDPRRADEVLDLAVAFLARHGLVGLSMRKLAAYLGVSTNTISYQFGSRDGLIDAALARARSATLDMLTDLRTRRPELPVADAVRELWAWWREEPERLAFPRLNLEAMLTSDTATVSPERRRDLLLFWVHYFTEWLVAEGRGRREAERLASLMLAALTGLIVDHLSTGEDAGGSEDTENIRRVDDALDLLAAALER